jgi:hypothetical protein
MKWNSVPDTYEVKFKAYDLYSHSVDNTNRRTDSYLMARQPDGEFGYFNTNQFALTSSNTFVGNQIISGNLDVTGDITANTYTITNTILSSGSIYMTGSIETVDHIDFYLNATPAHKEGRIHWDADRKTLEIDTEINNYMISAGHVNVVRGKNTTNATLTKGTVVYISGNSGQFAAFGTASYDSETRSAITFGIIAQDITQNNSGYAVMQGEITGINTNGFTPGTLLYLGAGGTYTSTKPQAPLHQVRLGQVVVASTNGILQVKIDNGWELDELHDVRITTSSLKDAATNNGGSTLYRSSSLWVNNDNIRLSQSTMILASVSSSYNFADDTTAAAGGVPLGGLYHTSGSVKIRLV